MKWVLKNREEQTIAKSPVHLNKRSLEILSSLINFSGEDSTQMTKQIEKSNKTPLTSILNSSKRFLNSQEIETLVNGKIYSFLKVSNPIYFENGKKVWIIIEEYCGGLCGSGQIQVYSINNSIYTLISQELIWIS